MASTKSFLVGIFLFAFVCSSFAQYHYDSDDETTSLVAQQESIPDGGSADLTITVAGPATNFDDEISIQVKVKVLHPHASELKVTLTLPGPVEVLLLRGTVNPSCDGKDIAATFSNFANVRHFEPFERCDNIYSALVYGDIRAVEANSLTPSSGGINGDYILTVRDLNNDGVSGTIEDFSIIISDDIDEDLFINSVDNCPITYNPEVGSTGYQADEDMDKVGNECQCESSNYDVTVGDKKVCYYLDNWGHDSKHYKGEKKNRGEFVSLVMPRLSLDEFQPGDYSHQNTWLGCDCQEYPILP